MPGFYQDFITARTTEADPNTLLQNLRSNDATIGVQHPTFNKYTLKKSTIWTQNQINAAQSTIDSCPPMTKNTTAQYQVDVYPISIQALILTLIDEINMLRGLHGLAAKTPGEVFQAIRAKAGTL